MASFALFFLGFFVSFLPLGSRHDFGPGGRVVVWKGENFGESCVWCLIRAYVDPNVTSEFKKIALATTVGFSIMGFIGFFVKLIHIPINNIIVGS